MRQQHKTVSIKACAVYAMANDMVITPLSPQADNVTVTLPDLSFIKNDVNIMGTVSIPDFTRLDNFTVTVNVPVDNPDIRMLRKLGINQWKITYVVSNISAKTGFEELTAYEVIVKGYIGSIPNGSVEQGGDGMVDISMDCLSYKKTRTDQGRNTFVEIDIDRLTNKVKVDGINYTAQLNSLY